MEKVENSRELLNEIKDDVELKNINGAGWERGAMEFWKLIMRASGKSCSYAPLNNFYSKSQPKSCSRGAGCTCR